MLGFSFSHDDDAVRIYANFADFRQEQIMYRRITIEKFVLSEVVAQKWRSRSIAISIYHLFISEPSRLLKQALDIVSEDPSAIETKGLQASHFIYHSQEESDIKADPEQPKRRSNASAAALSRKHIAIYIS